MNGKNPNASNVVGDSSWKFIGSNDVGIAQTLKSANPVRRRTDRVLPRNLSDKTRKPAPEIVTAVINYEAKRSDELNLQRGSIIEVISKNEQDEGWWYGKMKDEVERFYFSKPKVVS